MDSDAGHNRTVARACERLEAMVTELAQVDDDLTGDEWLCVRARLGVLTAEFNTAIDEIDQAKGTTGARGRLLRYFQIRVGQAVTKDELSGVAGIHAWARRVRELRQDLGWDIRGASTREGLEVGEYILLSDSPDAGLAAAWTKARQMRNLRTIGGSPSAKIRTLEFLKAIHPRCADHEQLAHVAQSPDSAERALEDLRADGWSIVQCTADSTGEVIGHALGSLEPLG